MGGWVPLEARIFGALRVGGRDSCELPDGCWHQLIPTGLAFLALWFLLRLLGLWASVIAHVQPLVISFIQTLPLYLNQI